MRKPPSPKCANTLCVAAQHIKTLRSLLLGLVLAAGFQGCASAAEPLPPHRPAEISPSTIHGFNGPEDMQLTPDRKHIVVSELPLDWAHPQGPSLVLVDLPDDRVHPLSVKMQAESGWGDPACPVPAAFSTHGLFVSQRPDGHVQIIAVNHTGRESIEFIELVNGASGYNAIWRGCVAFDGGSFNDLVAYGSNGLIATVMLDKTLVGGKDPMAFLFSGAKTGYLAEWNPRTGWKHLPGSEAALNNGIQLSADSRFVWFTAWTSRQVLKYDLQAQRITRSVAVPFSPDNLTLKSDGTVIVAGIDDLARWRDCTAEEGHFCQDKLAFSVVTLDPKTFTVKPLFHGKPGLLQGASVALAIDNALYVGTATGDRLLKISSVELATPRERERELSRTRRSRGQIAYADRAETGNGRQDGLGLPYSIKLNESEY